MQNQVQNRTVWNQKPKYFENRNQNQKWNQNNLKTETKTNTCMFPYQTNSIQGWIWSIILGGDTKKILNICGIDVIQHCPLPFNREQISTISHYHQSMKNISWRNGCCHICSKYRKEENSVTCSLAYTPFYNIDIFSFLLWHILRGSWYVLCKPQITTTHITHYT